MRVPKSPAVLAAVAGSFASQSLIAAKAAEEKAASEARVLAAEEQATSYPEPTSNVRYGTERLYLLYRLNKMHRDLEDPGMADYVGVRQTGAWEVAA